MRKKNWLFVLIVILFINLNANAAGLFPSLQETHGTAMPSIKFAIGKEPSIQESTENGTRLVYDGFSKQDYDVFNQYLGSNYKGELVAADGKVVTVTLSKEGTRCIFTYDRGSKTATIEYPDGTREENQKNAADNSDVLPLPSLFEVYPNDILPAASNSSGRPADVVDAMEDGSYSETYNGFSAEEYEKFSLTLSDYGCNLLNYSVDEDILTAYLQCGNSSFILSYDSVNSIAVVTYPTDALVEKEIPQMIVEETPMPSPTPKNRYTWEECHAIAEDFLYNNLSWKNPASVTVHGTDISWDSEEFTFTFDVSAQNTAGGQTRDNVYIKVSISTGEITFVWTNAFSKLI